MKTIIRVHIAPIGRHLERIVEPLITLKADRVYLISYSEDDKAAEFLKQTKQILKKNNIEVKTEFTDIWNLTSCIETFQKIIQNEKDNQVFFNVSTGTKITAIAGMISCMIEGIQPYYAKAKYPSVEFPKKINLKEINEIVSLPTFIIEKPKKESIEILKLVENQELSKKELIQILKENNTIKSQDGETLSKPAEHGQLKTILQPLFNAKQIETETRGRQSFVKITQKGKTALSVFR